MSWTTRLRTATGEVHVTLSPEGEGFDATVEGATHRVVRIGAGARGVASGGVTVEELALEVDGRPCRALVARRRDRVLVALDGHVYEFETGEETRAAGAGAGRGSGAVTAPMPGKIIAVLVAVGDTVEAGQAVVVLEAMKMETTLTSEIAGRVTGVHVEAGGMVDGGALLLEIAG
jgi:3-methylcrotonyl-CoA carboxylase alpha subunit